MRWIFSSLPPNISIGRRIAMLSSSTQPASRCSRFVSSAAPAQLLDHRHQNRAAGGAVLQLLARAEQQQLAALVFVLAKARNEPRETEGQQTPVEIADDLEQIGQRDGEGHRLAVEFDDHREFRRRGEAESVGDGVEFVEGEGHETPIVAPAVVEEVRHQLRLALFHAGIVDLADFQPVFPLAPVRDAGRLVQVVRRQIEAIGDEIARLHIAERLDMAGEIRRMPRRQEHRASTRKPATSMPHSPLIVGENGPLMRSAPRAFSQSSAAPVRARTTSMSSTASSEPN